MALGNFPDVSHSFQSFCRDTCPARELLVVGLFA